MTVKKINKKVKVEKELKVDASALDLADKEKVVVAGVHGSGKMEILDLKKELRKKKFTIAIFGSARTKKGDKRYDMVYELAKEIGKAGYDVVTGGGPGMMEAANEGHAAGDKKGVADSIGLVIKLPWENSANGFVELKKTFNRFSDRLETFLALMSVAVITDGGIGTLLELSYMWQYTQVGKVPKFPIILVGKMWKDLLKWAKKDMLKAGLVSAEDFDNVFIAEDNVEAMKIIKKAYKEFAKHPKERKPVLKPSGVCEQI